MRNLRKSIGPPKNNPLENLMETIGNQLENLRRSMEKQNEIHLKAYENPLGNLKSQWEI